MAWRAGEQSSAAWRVTVDAAPARLSRALAVTLVAAPAHARVLSIAINISLLDPPGRGGRDSLTARQRDGERSRWSMATPDARSLAHRRSRRSLSASAVQARRA
jgi:hypothetical protein